MIPVIIFFGHTVFAIWAFAKSYQSDGLVQAFLNLFFIIIIFTVGWTITDLFVGFFISDAGYEIFFPVDSATMIILKITGIVKMFNNTYGKLMPKDVVSLIVLSVVEFLFYKFYLKQTVKKA